MSIVKTYPAQRMKYVRDRAFRLQVWCLVPSQKVAQQFILSTCLKSFNAEKFSSNWSVFLFTCNLRHVHACFQVQKKNILKWSSRNIFLRDSCHRCSADQILYCNIQDTRCLQILFHSIWHKKMIHTYFNGLARTLCPIVTKLVSWLLINHASDDTLQPTIIKN